MLTQGKIIQYNQVLKNLQDYMLNDNCLHLSTSKTPTVLAFMTGKGNSYNALFKCEGLRNKTMETLISNLIDHTLQHNFSEADKCRILIKQYKPDVYDKIIYAANSIIYNYDLIIS